MCSKQTSNNGGLNHVNAHCNTTLVKPLIHYTNVMTSSKILKKVIDSVVYYTWRRQGCTQLVSFIYKVVARLLLALQYLHKFITSL